MKSFRTAVAVFGAILSFGAAVAWGAAPTTADYIKARQTRYHDLGAAFKAAMDQLKLSPPDLAVIRQSAKVITALSNDQYHLFQPGSGPEAGVKTGAKPEIWSNPTGFATAQNDFRARAAEFSLAANGSDPAAITAAAQKLGQTCNKCHTQFRVKN